MKKISVIGKILSVVLAMALVLGLAACTPSENSGTENPITSTLQTSYEVDKPVDLSATVEEGWTLSIAIRRGNTPMVNKLDGTSYTFKQTGEYTIVYTATKGSTTKTLEVSLSITAAVGDALVVFEGETLQVVLYTGTVAKVYNKATNEELLETTYAYIRNQKNGADGQSASVEPNFYIYYPGLTEENGLPSTAASVKNEDGDLTLSFDYTSNGKEIKDDTLVAAKAKWSEKFNTKKVMSFTGMDSAVRASYTFEMYEDGMCSIFNGGREVTAGRLNYQGSVVPLGGGKEGNDYGGGFWTFSGTQAEPELTVTISGVSYPVTKSGTNELQFTYNYAMSSFVRSITLSAPASQWVPALLGIAPEKVTFTGAKTTIICYDDEEQTVGVFNGNNTEKAIQEGNWSFDSITRAFKIKLTGDQGSLSAVTVVEGRLNATYTNTGAGIENDLLETSLDWDSTFPKAGVPVITGNGLLTADLSAYGQTMHVENKPFTMTIFDNGTYMVQGSVTGTNDHTESGTYTFVNNTFTFTSVSHADKMQPFSTTFANGTYTIEYQYSFLGSNYPVTLTFAPELVLEGNGGEEGRELNFVLLAYEDGNCAIFGGFGNTANAHTDFGTWTKTGDVYTFNFKTAGTVSTTGTGASISLGYKFTSSGTDYTINLTPAAAVTGEEAE